MKNEKLLKYLEKELSKDRYQLKMCDGMMRPKSDAKFIQEKIAELEGYIKTLKDTNE